MTFSQGQGHLFISFPLQLSYVLINLQLFSNALVCCNAVEYYVLRIFVGGMGHKTGEKSVTGRYYLELQTDSNVCFSQNLV